LDIVIEQNTSTIQFLTPICEKIESDKAIDFKLENLREIHRASIARIYGDKGHEILEGLRKNPQIAIPIILRRLNQKDGEWTRARNELNKFWREIYEKNHKKSFETRSLEFKNFDKKLLNPKCKQICLSLFRFTQRH
jgi:paired amphipathic helix protein Sin3a